MSGAQFWRIRAPRGEFALRRWPIEHPAPDRLRFIHAVLRHAATNGCDFLPVPATTRSGETFIRHADHLWELAPWMPGTADYETSPSVEKLRAAMHALARFHNAVAEFPASAAPGSAGGSNAIQRHLARLRELSPSRISELATAITDTTWPELAPLARQFLANLPRAVPHAIAAARTAFQLAAAATAVHSRYLERPHSVHRRRSYRHHRLRRDRHRHTRNRRRTSTRQPCAATSLGDLDRGPGRLQRSASTLRCRIPCGTMPSRLAAQSSPVAIGSAGYTSTVAHSKTSAESLSDFADF